jgi:hypothetical protein
MANRQKSASDGVALTEAERNKFDTLMRCRPESIQHCLGIAKNIAEIEQLYPNMKIGPDGCPKGQALHALSEVAFYGIRHRSKELF